MANRYRPADHHQTPIRGHQKAGLTIFWWEGKGRFFLVRPLMGPRHTRDKPLKKHPRYFVSFWCNEGWGERNVESASARRKNMFSFFPFPVIWEVGACSSVPNLFLLPPLPVVHTQTEKLASLSRGREWRRKEEGERREEVGKFPCLQSLFLFFSYLVLSC